MNKFLTFAGTQPVYLGDIDFMQNAAASGFKQLARALMDSSDDNLNAILQGVVITRPSSGVASWTAGVVVLNGEILPVEAGTVSDAGLATPLYFHVISSLSGDRTFENGETHSCWDTRSATISTVSEGGIAVSSVARLHESDNLEFVGTPASESLITAGRLIMKNGLWYCDVSVSLPSMAARTSLGMVEFYGLTAEQRAGLVGLSVDAALVIHAGRQDSATQSVLDDGYKVLPVTVAFTYTTGRVQLTISFMNENTYAIGNARLCTLLPIL